MTPTTGSAPSPTVRARWRKAAAALLGLEGIQLAIYAPMLPAPGGLMIAGWPGFGFGVGVVTVLGITAIAAAVGVWRGRACGRTAAVPVTLGLLAYETWWPLQRPGLPSSTLEMIPHLVGSLLVPVACSAFILFVLARRWTPPAAGRWPAQS